MDQTYDFGENFQIKLLSLVYSGTLAPPVVNASYFQNPIHSEICESIVVLRQQYSDVTREMVDTHLLRKRIFRDKEYRLELKEILSKVFKVPRQQEIAYLHDLAFKFAKLQQYRNFFRKGVDILQNQDIESLEQLDGLFHDTSVITQHSDDIGDFYFSSLSDRLKYRAEIPRVLKTQIPPLDSCLADGGFAKGELVVFAGLASTGKSFALLHMATAALLQMKKTVFYSLEMDSYKVATRIDAAFSGIATHQIRQNSEVVEKRLTSLMSQFGDNLLIKRMPAGQTKVSDIRAHLDMLKFRGFVPEVMIVDYINLMRPESATREGRHRDIGEVYIGLKGLGQERNMYPITAAQSNRSGFNAPLITIAHFADSFEGGMHCLVSTSLIDTPRDLTKYPDGIPIKDLVGKEFYTYSWSRKQKRFVLRKAKSVCRTGRKAEVWKLKWYDAYRNIYGEVIATPNHRIMLKDGTYKQLRNLSIGERLRVFRRSAGRYAQIRVADNEHMMDEHSFIYKELHGKLPSGYVVHHHDGEKLNNTPENLTLETRQEHSQHHNLGKIVSEDTRYKMSIHQRGEGHWNYNNVTSIEVREKISNSTLGSRNHMFGKTTPLDVREKQSIARLGSKNSNFNKKHTLESNEKRVESRKRFFRVLKSVGMSHEEFKQKFGHLSRYRRSQIIENFALSNHKVVSVEFYGYEDVYDMEVEGTHNFVANEIVVHNSDIVITLNRDDDEADQEKIRLYVAKDRDGVDKKIIKGYTNYKKGAFWSRKHSRSLS